MKEMNETEFLRLLENEDFQQEVESIIGMYKDLYVDFESLDPKRLMDSLFMDENTTEDLLNLIKKGAEEVKVGFQKLQCDHNINAYTEIGKRYSIPALILFNRLSEEKEMRLPAFLISNRTIASKKRPDSVLFWADCDAIVGFYESLEKDGYYASTTRT